jgi:hypothetical protein
MHTATIKCRRMSDWMKLVQPFNLIGLLNPITDNQ